MKKVLFKRRKTKDIPNVPIIDGQLVYDTETGATYMDVGDKRISTGGGDGGTSEELIKPTYYYGDLNYRDGSVIDNTTAYQRTTGKPIDCLEKGLKLKVPLVSANYKETADSVQIRFFAYDSSDVYVGGVEPDGTVLKPGQQQKWANIPHGSDFTLKKGYKYKFVNSNAAGTNTFKSNEAALSWMENELEVYVLGEKATIKNASELAADVPDGLPSDTPKNTQAVLDAINSSALKKSGGTMSGNLRIVDKKYLIFEGNTNAGIQNYGGVKIFGYGPFNPPTNTRIYFKIGDIEKPLQLRGKPEETPLYNNEKIALDKDKVSLPASGFGIAGQFAVSDGKGGINWLTLENAAEVGM